MSIKSLMSERGMNASQLSYAAHVPAQRVGEYLKGTRDIREARLRTVLNLMDALGTDDVYDLLDDNMTTGR